MTSPSMNKKKRSASSSDHKAKQIINKKRKSEQANQDTIVPTDLKPDNDPKNSKSPEKPDISQLEPPTIKHSEPLNLLDKIDMTQPYLSEEQVGIQCYINQHLPSFSAILKHRFTDFLVYEVDKNDEVIRLKDIENPCKDEEVRNTQASKGPKETVDPKEWPSNADEKLVEILNKDKLAELKMFVARGPVNSQRNDNRSKDFNNRRYGGRGDPKSNGMGKKDAMPGNVSGDVSNAEASGAVKNEGQQPDGSSKEDVAPSVPPQDPVPTCLQSDPIDCKEQRKKFHQIIRETFRGGLVTEHKELPSGEAVIELKWSPPGQHQERRLTTPDTNPPYIHFTLQKTNRETQEALSILSNLLHCKNVSRDFGICGTKDKRSVSCQRVSFKRGRKDMYQIWSTVNRVKKNQKSVGFSERGDKGIRLGDFTYEDHPLKLGDSKGNRFVIILRDVNPAKPTVLREAVESLSKSGFLNYFGMQRFGTTAVGTHLIGLSLLKSDWDMAIDLIMRKKLGETQDAEHARSVWEQTKDATATLELMPRRCVAERCILQYFSKRAGHTDKVGALASIPKNLKMMYIHAYQSYIWNHVLSERVRLYGCDKPVVGDLIAVKDGGDEIVEATLDSDDETKTRENKVASVKALNDEAECQSYTIQDVVLPLIGYRIEYPKGTLGQMYIDMMKRDGLDPENLRRGQADYSMAGTYRKILHMPTDVRYALYEYEDPELPLSYADEDKLIGMKLPEPIEWTSTDDENTQKRNMALKVELTLGSSAYATMALREILKSDTGKGAQSKMTDRMRERMAKET
ncbi:pseudouridine synthase [Melampsora americana]|nr:pseudouridine synthase [Melampsora americana]